MPRPSSRSTWRGAIRLSLITIPIRAFPATASSDVAFRQLHRVCHTPIQLKKWCPHCEEEVTSDDVVKGYESSKGQFVIVEEEEVAKVQPESTHTVELSYLIEAKDIDPVYIERVYFLAPDNKAAGSAYAVLREGLGERAGVGHLALRGREYLVAIVPHDNVLEMYTLRTAGEVRDAEKIDELGYADVSVKPDEVKLARMVLQHVKAAPDLSTFTDRYQETLKEMLAAKQPEVVAAGPGKRGKGGKVVDLMEALRDSLAQVSSSKTATARLPHKKPKTARARVIAHPAGRTKHRRAS